ncbi:lipopolysaccharide biosynthesis protein [Eilatimonas milleporae]|uniref:O-antigen/teichoic acid export membrane protein n=1 Tax=Eilatimonas milleporae TaxID=911205 RepID=A0A3M0C597_9PROT|nr:polysaccharide biosynthesis C-terminal domain-containing protein [Eilatimonas milleporae]RMB04898.1 O-antigen/teichoic acid export membrane protein [Eilatimonas milleporae]
MMSAQNRDTDQRRRLAGGAGAAFLGRLGAVIEVASILVFTWAYGTVGFGLFAVLWSFVKIGTAVAELAMPTAQQRFVPQADETGAHAAAGFAMKISVAAAVVIALAVTAAAPYIAPHINTGDASAGHMTDIVRLYVWVLPFWTLIEVATAAIRARRTFGPEIRVRIFYEQGLRLLAALAFAGLGWQVYGLFLAHLVSTALAAILALRLVARHYDLRKLASAPMTGDMPRTVLLYGLSVMPAGFVKKLVSELPVIFLNFLLAGAAGAAAGGIYAVARKVASVLQLVRLPFDYVIAPIASETAAKGDSAQLADLFAFATRLSLALVLPLATALIAAGNDILALMRPEYQAAYAAIVILSAGRISETFAGPSPALVEMLAHRSLPAINGLAGLGTLAALSYALIPSFGVAGGALAAAAGLNITALLAFMELRLLFRLSPLTRSGLPVILAAIIAGAAILAGGLLLRPYGPPWGLAWALVSFALSVAGIIRFVLPADDRAALPLPILQGKRGSPA